MNNFLEVHPTDTEIFRAIILFGANVQSYKFALEMAGRDSVKEYVKTGLGVSILNEYYIPSTDKRTLSVKDVSKFFGAAERGVIILKNRIQSHAVEEFLKELHG